jgi:hypothetical protein
MAVTRSRTRMNKTKKQVYRSRVKSSPCRGQTSKCREKYGCKKTKAGRRKTYCRKTKNRSA